ncbi:hypothetical protein K8R47_00280 [archaeon]|nr:hypothetical protein [archaeon]
MVTNTEGNVKGRNIASVQGPYINFCALDTNDGGRYKSVVLVGPNLNGFNFIQYMDNQGIIVGDPIPVVYAGEEICDGKYGVYRLAGESESADILKLKKKLRNRITPMRDNMRARKPLEKIV